MKYRTVPVYPQVGDKINKAIERIATKQQAARRRDEAGAGRGHRRTCRRPGSRSDTRGLSREFACVAPSPNLSPWRGRRVRRWDGLRGSNTASSPGAWRRRWRCWRSSRCCRRSTCWPPASRRSTSRGPRRCGTSRSRCENYRQLWADDALPQLGLGAGQAVVLDGAAAAPDRARPRPAAQHAHRALLEALRTVFLIPMVLPPIVVAIIWKVIYTPDISPHARRLPARSAGTCRR